MKDLIISAVTKYTAKELYNYVESINRCGFSGDKIMVVYDVTDETIDYLKDNGWELFKANSEGHIHMHRLITMYWVLRGIKRKYRHMITTDVRDVVFQHNPSDWLQKNLKKDILVSTENVLYKHEAWGEKNIKEGYNELLWDRYKDNHSCNVGVLAGKYDSMMDLLLLNYMVSQSGDTNHFTDQSSFNFIVHNSIAKDAVQITGIDESWALQLGTMDNENLIGERKNNIDEFTIIHQYDRVSDINEYVTRLLS